LEPTGAGLYDGGKNTLHPELSNGDVGALPRSESRQDISGTNVGRTTDSASRECHASPDLELF